MAAGWWIRRRLALTPPIKKKKQLEGQKDEHILEACLNKIQFLVLNRGTNDIAAKTGTEAAYGIVSLIIWVDAPQFDFIAPDIQ